MSVPDKYKALGGFHKYVRSPPAQMVLILQILHRRDGCTHTHHRNRWEPRSVQLHVGAVSARVLSREDRLTIVDVRYHGGWLAQNIYFLGHAGCVRVNGVRIAGASGIFNSRDFHQG
jgi:lariat debranching enzyme